jgi:uncharacterized membrane protein YtjA (UPF0391 family)
MGAAIKWAIGLAASAVIAGVLGFGALAGVAAAIAKFLSLFSAAIVVVLLIVGFDD